MPSHEIGDDDMWALEEIFWRIISVLVSSRPRVWINHWSVLGQDRSDTKKSVLVLEAVVLVLQFWCFFVKDDLVTLVVIMIFPTSRF